jgi:hypothetical protein
VPVCKVVKRQEITKISLITCKLLLNTHKSYVIINQINLFHKKVSAMFIGRLIKSLDHIDYFYVVSHLLSVFVYFTISG